MGQAPRQRPPKPGRLRRSLRGVSLARSYAHAAQWEAIGVDKFNVNPCDLSAIRTTNGNPNLTHFGRGFELGGSDRTSAHGENRQTCNVLYLLHLVNIQTLRHGAPLRFLKRNQSGSYFKASIAGHVQSGGGKLVMTPGIWRLAFFQDHFKFVRKFSQDTVLIDGESVGSLETQVIRFARGFANALHFTNFRGGDCDFDHLTGS